MFRQLHPFTTLGLLLALTAPLFFVIGMPQVGIMLLLLAFGVTSIEFKKYTSEFQFAMLMGAATGMGIALDMRWNEWPLLTAAMFLASTSMVVRQAWMQHLTYVNWLWLDTGLAVLAGILYGIAIAGTSFQWDLWLPPLLPIGCAVFLTFSYAQDAVHMRKHTRFGYRVRLGEPAPEFELPDQDGKPVKLSDYRGKHPLLLIFVRGDWCPGCHMMLRTYERNRERFLEKGIHVLGIGPDNIAVNNDMAKRIGIGYRMLSDDAQKVSGQYGVVYSNPAIEITVDYSDGIPLPASFLVDVQGVVRYASRPDRVGEFLNPQLIFNVLNELPAEGTLAWTSA
ncbi:MAG: redoxin domain-containing protein [Flavobacteriales bacterium]|nr:redoxin domain-containing protein [Flavobacteriales bacterium]